MTDADAPKLLESIREFLFSFELVFGSDWEFTKAAIENAEEMHFIAPGATFLEPECGDEHNNWHNRGSLLAAHRRLLEVLGREGIYDSEFREK